MPLAPIAIPTPTRRRGGFTFIEVMFAVMILGFGVIMIAAMLPVALRQTQTARETVAGSAVCESGFHFLEDAYASRDNPNVVIYNLPTTFRVGNGPAEAATYPGGGTELPYNATMPLVPLLHATLGDRISSGDATTAFIPFYLDGGDAPLVTLLGVGVRNVPTMSDANAPSGSALRPGAFFLNPANCPLPVAATMIEGTRVIGSGANQRREDLEPDRIALAGRAGVSDAQIAQAAVEGAAVVLRNAQGKLRVYRLGKPRDDLVPPAQAGLLWDLAPGGDMEGAATTAGKIIAGSEARADANNDPVPVVAYLVGRMLKNPGAAWTPGAAGDNKYVGPTQVTQVLESQQLR